MDQSAPNAQPIMTPMQIDRNVAKLARAVEATYGNFWSVVWRNFLAGFMRVLGMAAAYAIIMTVTIFILLKTGLFGQLQNVWKNITQGLINDVQKNLQNSLPKIELNPNQIQNMINNKVEESIAK